MNRLFKSIALPAIIMIAMGSINAQEIIQSKDYGMGFVKDCTPTVLKMILDAKEKGISKIHIAPGTYHFYPEKAFEKYCFITNHDDGLKSTPFPLIGFDNLQIEAKDAKFIFHGVMIPFIIEESNNLQLSGFTIDWELPLGSEVLVVGSDPENKTFDIRINPNQPYEIRNGELFFLKEGYEHNINKAIYWDPATGAIAYNTDKYAPVPVNNKPSVVGNIDAIEYFYEPDLVLPINSNRGIESSVFAEELKEGLVRIHFSDRTAPPIGLVLVCKGMNGGNRLSPAIRIANSDDISIENISIYSAGGMGVVAEGSSNITLNHVKVEPAPGKGRFLSTSADATHFVNCRGLIKMNNSTFSNMLDDATNVHGIFLTILDVLGPKKVGVEVGHYQQMGFDFGIPGDEIAFIVGSKSYTPLFKAKLVGMEKINKRYFILDFDRNLNMIEGKEYSIENLSAYPKVEITNCSILNNRARGLLISTPKSTLIENNYFNTMMSAILMSSEMSHWHESGAAGNVIIRNNKFGDCCYGGNSTPVIYIHTSSKSPEYIFHNILIENNEFHTFDSAILHANKVSGLIFRRNTVTTSDTYKPLRPDQPSINIEESVGVEVAGNVIETGFENKLQLDKVTKLSSTVKMNIGIK